nr:MAG TPA: hypothetical protein [Caudoviricetes sp.]
MDVPARPHRRPAQDLADDVGDPQRPRPPPGRGHRPGRRRDRGRAGRCRPPDRGERRGAGPVGSVRPDRRGPRGQDDPPQTHIGRRPGRRGDPAGGRPGRRRGHHRRPHPLGPELTRPPHEGLPALRGEAVSP